MEAYDIHIEATRDRLGGGFQHMLMMSRLNEISIKVPPTKCSGRAVRGKTKQCGIMTSEADSLLSVIKLRLQKKKRKRKMAQIKKFE